MTNKRGVKQMEPNLLLNPEVRQAHYACRELLPSLVGEIPELFGSVKVTPLCYCVSEVELRYGGGLVTVTAKLVNRSELRDERNLREPEFGGHYWELFEIHYTHVPVKDDRADFDGAVTGRLYRGKLRRFCEALPVSRGGRLQIADDSYFGSVLISRYSDRNNFQVHTAFGSNLSGPIAPVSDPECGGGSPVYAYPFDNLHGFISAQVAADARLAALRTEVNARWAEMQAHRVLPDTFAQSFINTSPDLFLPVWREPLM